MNSNEKFALLIAGVLVLFVIGYHAITSHAAAQAQVNATNAQSAASADAIDEQMVEPTAEGSPWALAQRTPSIYPTPVALQIAANFPVT